LKYSEVLWLDWEMCSLCERLDEASKPAIVEKD